MQPRSTSWLVRQATREVNGLSSLLLSNSSIDIWIATSILGLVRRHVNVFGQNRLAQSGRLKEGKSLSGAAPLRRQMRKIAQWLALCRLLQEIGDGRFAKRVFNKRQRVV
jgi:hypothetical protein